MDFRDGEIVVDKPSNGLDDLVLGVVDVLDDFDVRYAVVSGYVAVLFGRARATEDVDVIVERFDEAVADDVATTLRNAGYWGAAMPLDELYATLSDGLPIRVARDGTRIPNVECKFPTDEFDRESLRNTVTVRLADGSIQIGSLELQIAYKLSMGAQKDFEDAVHLFDVAEPTLNREQLEAYVDRLGVEDDYERLRSTR